MIASNIDWPLGVARPDKMVLKYAEDGDLMMLGHIVGDCFYTPDLGRDK